MLCPLGKLWLVGPYSLCPLAMSPQRMSWCNNVERIEAFSSNSGDEAVPGDLAGGHQPLWVCFVALPLYMPLSRLPVSFVVVVGFRGLTLLVLSACEQAAQRPGAGRLAAP